MVTTSMMGCYFYLILCMFCVRANINEMAKRVTQNLRDIHLGTHKKAEILNLLDRTFYCCANDEGMKDSFDYIFNLYDGVGIRVRFK